MQSLFKRIGLSRRLLYLILPLCLIASLHAQSLTGDISGLVADIQGGALPNATVIVTNVQTGIARTVTTDAGGRYQVGTLIPGTYKITVEAPGFKKSELTGITVNVSQVIREDVTLNIGGQTETVTVEAAALTTETETSSNGQVIDNTKIVELPLANRQFYNLAQLAPGVLPPAQASTLGFRGGFNVNGAPETDNQFLVNGTFNNDMGTNQPSFRPSVETIAEFKVLSGVYSADYGRFAGGQIVMITKQGTNKFHGSAYEFIRNGAIEAKPWSPTPQTLNPAFKQNTFGVTIGGPIIRDKAFFFFGYEGQRIRQQLVAASTVPTSWAINGCSPAIGTQYNPYTGATLSTTTSGACTGVPGGGYDITQLKDAAGVNLYTTAGAQLSQQMMKLAYPLPNVAPTSLNGLLSNATAPSNNYLFSETRRESSNAYNVRGDYKLSDKDSFYGTWNYFNDPSYEPSNSLCATRTLPNFGCFTNQLSTLANIGEIHIFEPTLLNDIRFGFSRLVQPRIQEDNYTIGNKWPGLPGAFNGTAPNNLGLPPVMLTNYTTSGGQTNLPQNRWTNHFQFADVLTWNHRAHTFKFGFDMTDVKSTEFETTTGRGSVTYSNTAANTNNGNPTLATSPHFGTTGYSLGDALLGIPASTADTPTAPITYNRFTSFDFFAMDDWKVTPYLTLNLGIRYELDSPVSEKYGQISTFVPSTQNFVIAAQAGQKSLYQYDRNNFAPRIGFAWQPFKNEKTVVKSGFGVFYQEPILYNEFLNYSLQYPVRYPKTFTSAAVNQNALTGRTIASSPNTLTLDNPFNPASIPQAGQPYCVVANSSPGCTTLTPVVTGTSIDPKYATPYWDEWTLAIQREINHSTIAEVGYYGSKGSRISGTSTLNYNTLGVSADSTAQLQAERVYSQWGGIGNHKTGFNSEYESLYARLQESTRAGINFLLSYTFGKSEDGVIVAQNPNPAYIFNGKRGSQSGDKSLSAFDVRHRLVFSPVVQLPFGKGHAWLNTGISSAIAGGWQISGIYQYFTGRPFNITDSSVASGSFNNPTGNTSSNDRPNVYGNVNGGTDQITGNKTHTAAEWFNIHTLNWNGATQAARPKGSFGTLGPNAITGPGFDEIDVTVARTFSIKEYAKTEFRMEAFNVANHPNYQNPSGSFTGSYAGGFGTVTAANNMRELQGSLRILF